MVDLLLSEINAEHSELLNTLLLIERHIFESEEGLALEPILSACQDSTDGIDDNMAKAECFINELFVNQIFLDNHRANWPSLTYKINASIQQRIASPVVKAAIIQFLANQSGLESDLVFIPEKIMVRILCDDMYSIIFDPVTGESLNWQQLNACLDDLKSASGQVYVEPMSRKSLLIEYLSGLKSALLDEAKFEEALRCVDLMLAITPKSDQEAKDKGLLTHQQSLVSSAYQDKAAERSRTHVLYAAHTKQELSSHNEGGINKVH